MLGRDRLFAPLISAAFGRIDEADLVDRLRLEGAPRFGFSAEKARALESPFPPNAFMAAELTANALVGIRGRVRYPAAIGL